MKILKKILSFTCVLVAFYACSPTETTNNSQTKSEINTFLDNWHLAATKADFDGYFSKMDSLSIYIGTDASENWTKKEFESFSKPYFKRGSAWSFKAVERNIYTHNNIAWFDELLDTWMGPCRGSGVLEKKNDSWVIKHYVLSMTVPNDDVQKVIAAKRKTDSIFMKQFD